MNQLNVGFSKSIELPKGGYLIIDDQVRDIPRSRVFDPLQHSFNPMKGIDEDKAEDLAELLYTLSPGGDATLTVRNGKIALASALLDADRFDRVKGNEEVSLMMSSLLFSPTRRNVLCKPTNFSFNVNSVIQARINRAELGDKTALTLGLFLMSHYKGQLVVPDFGFYGRDIHSRLIREERLIAGVYHLGELSPALRKTVLLIDQKIPSGATVEDAEELAKYVRPALGRDTNKYRAFIEDAIA
jgi:hypothetical protein